MLLNILFLLLCINEKMSAKSFAVNNKSMRIVLLEDYDKFADEEKVDIKDYPWMVSVQERNKYSELFHICGGSLLTTNFVLTAHHCLPSDKNPETLFVRSGSSNSHEGGIIHSVNKIIPHPHGYDVRYDLAILKIQPQVRFEGDKSLPIQIFIEKVNPNTRGIVLGWGYANLIPARPVKFLQKAEITIMGKDYCEKFTGKGDFLLCSSENEPGVCSGDSGGPLLIDGQLAGVISIGGCESLSHSDSFVNISYHREWIENTIDPSALS